MNNRMVDSQEERGGGVQNKTRTYMSISEGEEVETGR